MHNYGVLMKTNPPVIDDSHPREFHLEFAKRRDRALAIVEAVKLIQNSLTESQIESKHSNVFSAFLGYGLASVIAAFLGFYWIQVFYIVSVFAGVACRFVFVSEFHREQRRQALNDRLEVLRFQWISNGLESSSFDELVRMTNPKFIFKHDECGIWWNGILASVGKSVRSAFGFQDCSLVTNSADVRKL